MHYSSGKGSPNPSRILQTRNFHSGCNCTDQTQQDLKRKESNLKKRQSNWTKQFGKRVEGHKGFPSLSTQVSQCSLLQSHAWRKLSPDPQCWLLYVICYILFAICYFPSFIHRKAKQPQNQGGKKIRRPKSGKSQELREQEKML